MKHYLVVLEIETDGETPLDAAKTVQDWLRDREANWTFNVQDDETKEIFTVDLEEEDADAVLPIEMSEYYPMIERSN